MKPYHLFFTIFSVIGLLLAYAVWNVGLLKPVLIEEKELPTAVLIYQNVVGPYHNLSDVFKKIETESKKLEIDCAKTFGIYYDDPSSVEPERLRADVGCYSSTPPLKNLEGFQVKESPIQKALIGTFDGAPWLTAFKVYRAMYREAGIRKLKIKNGPIMEVYEPSPSGFKTSVVMSLEN